MAGNVADYPVRLEAKIRDFVNSYATERVDIEDVENKLTTLFQNATAFLGRDRARFPAASVEELTEKYQGPLHRVKRAKTLILVYEKVFCAGVAVGAALDKICDLPLGGLCARRESVELYARLAAGDGLRVPVDEGGLETLRALGFWVIHEDAHVGENGCFLMERPDFDFDRWKRELGDPVDEFKHIVADHILASATTAAPAGELDRGIARVAEHLAASVRARVSAAPRPTFPLAQMGVDASDPIHRAEAFLVDPNETMHHDEACVVSWRSAGIKTVTLGNGWKSLSSPNGVPSCMRITKSSWGGADYVRRDMAQFMDGYNMYVVPEYMETVTLAPTGPGGAAEPHLVVLTKSEANPAGRPMFVHTRLEPSGNPDEYVCENYNAEGYTWEAFLSVMRARWPGVDPRNLVGVFSAGLRGSTCFTSHELHCIVEAVRAPVYIHREDRIESSTVSVNTREDIRVVFAFYSGSRDLRRDVELERDHRYGRPTSSLRVENRGSLPDFELVVYFRKKVANHHVYAAALLDAKYPNVVVPNLIEERKDVTTKNLPDTGCLVRHTGWVTEDQFNAHTFHRGMTVRLGMRFHDATLHGNAATKTQPR